MNNLESTILDHIQNSEQGYSPLELVIRYGEVHNIKSVMDAILSLEKQELIIKDGDKYHAFENGDTTGDNNV